jgi:YegS/Rv2252/BmrU family lipid kinase
MLREEGFEVTLHRTAAPGDARTLARKLAGASDRLFLMGGDGTVNEVVNGLMDAQAAGITPAGFGVIPATTGNDFARSIGMPLAGRDAIQALARARPQPFDVGRVDYEADGQPVTRYFALACHLGLAAEVADRANRGMSRGAKRWGGTVPYLSILLRMVFRYEGCRLTATSGNDGLWDGPCLAAVLANGEFLGGGMRMAPGAKLDDGWLEFIGFGDFPLHNRLRYLPRIYPGTHVSVPGVRQQQVRGVQLEADRPTLLDVDGETIGFLPARVTLLPRALRVLIPPRRHGDTEKPLKE